MIELKERIRCRPDAVLMRIHIAKAIILTSCRYEGMMGPDRTEIGIAIEFAEQSLVSSRIIVASSSCSLSHAAIVMVWQWKIVVCYGRVLRAEGATAVAWTMRKLLSYCQAQCRTIAMCTVVLIIHLTKDVDSVVLWRSGT